MFGDDTDDLQAKKLPAFWRRRQFRDIYLPVVACMILLSAAILVRLYEKHRVRPQHALGNQSFSHPSIMPIGLGQADSIVHANKSNQVILAASGELKPPQAFKPKSLLCFYMHNILYCCNVYARCLNLISLQLHLLSGSKLPVKICRRHSAHADCRQFSCMEVAILLCLHNADLHYLPRNYEMPGAHTREQLHRHQADALLPHWHQGHNPRCDAQSRQLSILTVH